MSRFIAIAAGIAVLAALGITYYLTMGREGAAGEFAQCRSTAVADGGAGIGGEFTLVDETGKTVTSAEVLDQPSLIYFGYTFCPDVCPFDTARNADAVDLLADRGMSVTPVFITIDPERDTPEAVGEFASNLHPKMVGLTGSAEQIKAASQAYRTYYKKQDGDPDYYLVDHSTFTYLVLPGAGFVDYFRREVTPEQMADRVACFIEAT